MSLFPGSLGQTEAPRTFQSIWLPSYEPPHDKTNKMICVPSEDSDQPGHPPRLIRVFAVRMKKPWVLSYPLSAQRRLMPSLILIWSFAGCSHFVGFVMRRLILWQRVWFTILDWPCHNWASSWDYGTYHIGDQRRLRRTCASGQLHLCSLARVFAVHTHEVQTWTKGLTKNQTSSPTGWLHMQVWRISLRRTKSAIISWLGSI